MTLLYKRRQIIALVGAKRSGKDTIADMLLPFEFANYKISQRLKNICREMFGFTHEEVECEQKDAIHPKWGMSHIAGHRHRDYAVPTRQAHPSARRQKNFMGSTIV
jgi:hypothetical protein